MSLLSWFLANIYDAAMQRAERTCLGHWRQELLIPSAGRVLEIGAGTGVNLAYYPRTLTDLTLTEPDPHMRRQLSRKLATGNNHTQVVAASAEALPFQENSFDIAVVTLVLCSVGLPERSLKEIHRVLKPSGKLALIEHVRADDSGPVFRWQQRIEPIWKKCSGNCHLTRDTLKIISKAGFRCDEIKKDSMRGAISIVAPVIRGFAEKS